MRMRAKKFLALLLALVLTLGSLPAQVHAAAADGAKAGENSVSRLEDNLRIEVSVSATRNGPYDITLSIMQDEAQGSQWNNDSVLYFGMTDAVTLTEASVTASASEAVISNRTNYGFQVTGYDYSASPGVPLVISIQGAQLNTSSTAVSELPAGPGDLVIIESGSLSCCMWRSGSYVYFPEMTVPVTGVGLRGPYLAWRNKAVSWAPVQGAEGYSVKYYGLSDPSDCVTLGTTGTSVDLTDFITSRGGDKYRVEVKAQAWPLENKYPGYMEVAYYEVNVEPDYKQLGSTYYQVGTQGGTVTVSAESGTSFSALEEDGAVTGLFEEDDEITITATAAEGYHFSEILKNESTVSTDNPYIFTLKGNEYVSDYWVVFEEDGPASVDVTLKWSSVDGQQPLEDYVVSVPAGMSLSGLEDTLRQEIVSYFSSAEGYIPYGGGSQLVTAYDPITSYAAEDDFEDAWYEPLQENVTLYVMEGIEVTEASLTVEAPVCGAEVSLQDTEPYAQINAPVVTFPEGSLITLANDTSVPVYWCTQDYTDYEGTLLGGESYTALAQLRMSGIGYVMNWDTAEITVNGADPGSVRFVAGSLVFSVTAVHDMEEHPHLEPTASEDGHLEYYVCRGCGDWFLDEEGDLLIDNHDDIILPATGIRVTLMPGMAGGVPVPGDPVVYDGNLTANWSDPDDPDYGKFFYDDYGTLWFVCPENPYTGPEGSTFTGWKTEGQTRLYKTGYMFRMKENSAVLTAQWSGIYAVTAAPLPEYASWINMPATSGAGVTISLLLAISDEAWQAGYCLEAVEITDTQGNVTVVTKNAGGVDLFEDYAAYSSGQGSMFYPLAQFTMPESDVTVSARFIEPVVYPAVTLNPGEAGGAPVPGDAVVIDGADDGNWASGESAELGKFFQREEDDVVVFLLPESPFPAPEGYTFIGWKAEDSGTVYDTGSLVTDFPASFTAQWGVLHTITKEDLPSYAAWSGIPDEAGEGDSITIFITVEGEAWEAGYRLEALVITDAEGNVTEITKNASGVDFSDDGSAIAFGDGRHFYIAPMYQMPASDITLSARFTEPAPSWEGLFTHNVSFGSDLALIYYVTAGPLEGYENVRLVGTRERHVAGSTEAVLEDVALTEYREIDEGYGPEYRFVYDDIATKEVGDVLRVKVVAEKNGETFESPVDEYSAKDYAYSRLQKSTNVKFKTMIADLLYFCAKAQVYFGYDTEHLATDRMTEEFDAYATHGAVTPVDRRSEVPLDGATAEWAGVNTVFESRVELKYYFALDEAQPTGNVKLRLSYTTATGSSVVETVPLESCLYDDANKEYAYTYGGLAAKDMRVLITTQILDGDTVISPDKIYSLESYAAGRIANSGKPEFVELMYYMMAYGISAENNFGN
ncbi:MAG: hypothetical protein IJL66_08855 [Lachnospiraceae bacterium]|nr:hypothetical protein [Lachnospiraceae bacterium]